MDMDDKLEQPIKANISIKVRPMGKLTLVKPVQ